jgi:two-component system nitrogen regulation response regulator GlnG
MITYDDFKTVVPEFVSESPAMRKVADHICRDIFDDYNVLIIGERGVGKEFVAKAIQRVKHNDKEFYAFNCSNLTSTLFESQLFGYKKGAFTGADVDTKGILEEWDGQVVFLDEIADVDKNVTLAKLNRLLQDGTYYRVGDTTERLFTGIIIAATNKDVYDEEVFPRDLLDRFDWVIKVPPLRERTEDIEELVNHFREIATRETGPELSDEVVKVLKNYIWSGNVRELKKWVRHIMHVYSEAKEILSVEALEKNSHLPNQIYAASMTSKMDLYIPKLGGDYLYRTLLNDVRILAVKQALARTGGNIKKAHELIGVSESTIKNYKNKEPSSP